MTDLLTALAEMAAALGEGDEARAEQLWRSVPVAERGLIAAITLAAADRDVNQKQISDVGRFSRSHFTPSAKPSRREVAHRLKQIAALAGPVAEFILGGALPVRSRAEAEADVRQRDRTIHELRAALDRARADRQVTEVYARSLHEQLYPQVLENLRTREERVIDARPRLVAISDPEGDVTDDAGGDDDDPP